MVELVADASKMEAGLDAATTRVKSLGGKFQSLKSAALPIIGVAAGIGASLFQLTKMAAEDEAAQTKLARTLENVTGANRAVVASVEAQIEKFQKVSTFTDDELRPGFENLVRVTGNVDEAQKQLSTAMNISAATGKDLGTVTEAMARANLGNVGSLSRLGIATKDAEGNTLSFKDVMANANEIYGGQAQEAANTTAGKMAILKRDLGELGEKVGGFLIPIIAALTGFLVDKVIPAAVTLADKSKPLREGLVDAFKVIKGAVEEAWKVIGPILRFFVERLEDIIGIGGKAFEIAGKVGGIGKGIFKTLTPFHSGGIVPGAPGQSVPILAQAGERVVPAGAAAVTINVASQANPQMIAREVSWSMRTSGV